MCVLAINGIYLEMSNFQSMMLPENLAPKNSNNADVKLI